MSSQDKNIELVINDRDSLREEFYKKYDPDYWLYKVSLLKNCHDDFAKIKEVLIGDMTEVVDDDYKRVLRTEMHFLYFQMAEVLFEIIFAVSNKDNRDLWSELTFSDWRENYKEITALSETSELFTRNVKTIISEKECNIPLLRWIFYFMYPSKMTGEDWKNNLKKIETLLLVFAKDFSDRNEYNSYKHSLRFHNSSFSMSIGLTGSKQVFNIGSSSDSITYLEHQIKNGKPSGLILKTTKPFDTERDFKCCLIIHSMIKNIIETRKYSLLPELHGKEFDFFTYLDVDPSNITLSKTGVTRTSFTV
jgi:hypothetical protein